MLLLQIHLVQNFYLMDIRCNLCVYNQSAMNLLLGRGSCSLTSKLFLFLFGRAELMTVLQW